MYLLGVRAKHIFIKLAKFRGGLASPIYIPWQDGQSAGIVQAAKST